MMFLFYRRRLILCFILLLSVILQSCASNKESEPQIKIGMHIDAVMEFVVEYPLSWSKDRRLVYGRKDGEIRWTSPTDPHTLLRVKSFTHKEKNLDVEDQINQSLYEYAGLKISSKQKVTLPAGEAWHIEGDTTDFRVDIYLFLRTDRNYLISLTAPPKEQESVQEIMERVTHSFQIKTL